VDGRDIATGKAQSGIDTPARGDAVRRGGGPRCTRKVASFDAAERSRCGRRTCRADSRPVRLRRVQTRLVRRLRATPGRHGGRRALRSLGRRPECRLRFERLQGGARESARKPGRWFATTETSRRRRQRPRRNRRGVLHPTSRTRRWNRPPRRAHRERQVRRLGLRPSPQATRELVAKRLACRKTMSAVHVTLPRRGFGRKSKPDFAIEEPLCPKRWTGRPRQVTLGLVRNDRTTPTVHTVSVELSRRA